MEDYPDITLKDTAYGSGNYYGRCSSCGEQFQGHKMALSCKPCAEKDVTDYNALTQEERKKYWEVRREAVEAFFRMNRMNLNLKL